jgi:hypothetical protein
VFIGDDVFAGKPRSYRFCVALVGARLAREGDLTGNTIFAWDGYRI